MLLMGEAWSSLPGVVVGLVTAGMLLLAGAILALWLLRRGVTIDESQLHAQRLQRMAGGLFKWTHGFAADVSQHRSKLDELASRFEDAASARTQLPESKALEFYAEMVAANKQLRQRLQQAEDALKKQSDEISSYLTEARTDALTGLANRRAYDDELDRRFAEWKRYRTPISILLIDIDNFKSLNDRYGHLAGDEVLATVAQRLKETLRESDFAARFGGEEFAVVLPSTVLSDGGLAAARVRCAVEQAPFVYEEEKMQATISCGVAQAVEGETANEMVRRADKALDTAKNAGRNRCYLHTGGQVVPVPGDPECSTPVEPPRDEHDLGRMCADLRKRVLEVATDTSGPP
jgi:diguanylate cyclase